MEKLLQDQFGEALISKIGIQSWIAIGTELYKSIPADQNELRTLLFYLIGFALAGDLLNYERLAELFIENELALGIGIKIDDPTVFLILCA